MSTGPFTIAHLKQKFADLVLSLCSSFMEWSEFPQVSHIDICIVLVRDGQGEGPEGEEREERRRRKTNEKKE